MTAPLADRIRPDTLDDVVGQRHLLTQGKALRTIIDSGRIPNLVFYGPSGVGKTTVARIIAQRSDMRLHKLNGTNASTADIKAVVEELDTLAGINGILLYLDEIQYFNKKQQQSLLEHIENGRITLIASTTENPYFYVYNAVLSRSTVFEFKPVEPPDVEQAVTKGFAVPGGGAAGSHPSGRRRDRAHCGGLRRRRAQGAQRGGALRAGHPSRRRRRAERHLGHGPGSWPSAAL